MGFDLDRLTFTLTALGQPCGKTVRKSLRGKTKAGLDNSVSDGKGIVKIGGIGEIAHAELIEPLERASAALPANDHLDSESLRIHGPSIALLATGPAGRPSC